MTTDPLSRYSRSSIESRLLAGESAADIADDLCLDCVDDRVLLDGWMADDGNAEVYYRHAETGKEAAQDYVDDGDWGENDATHWVSVNVWRTGIGIDDGEIVESLHDEDTVTIAVDPAEPECEDGAAHDWASDFAVVGGIEENPGVWGSGGGVRMVRHCRRCGCGMHTDTWAQNPGTGEQGLTSVRYEPGEFSDAGGEE